LELGAPRVHSAGDIGPTELDGEEDGGIKQNQAAGRDRRAFENQSSPIIHSFTITLDCFRTRGGGYNVR